MSDYGLRVFGPSGEVFLATDDASCRFLTRMYIAPVDGSIAVPGLATGRPWFCAYREPSSTPAQYAVPNFTLIGGTLSWTYGIAPSGNRAPCYVWVGVY